MSRNRDIRRAVQALYQFDAGSKSQLEDDALAIVRESLAASSGDDTVHQEGFDLAVGAWSSHAEADHQATALAPQWPTHRQPVVDRCIIRLAYHELHLADTPPKVVINEAVELAKEFSTEKSHLFVNGILDKMYKQMRQDACGDDGEADGEDDGEDDGQDDPEAEADTMVDQPSDVSEPQA